MRRILPALLLCACTAPLFAQGLPGLSDPRGMTSGERKGSDDLLRRSAEPGIAPPLDIRIEGEGLSLPKGVSEDDRPATPPESKKESGAPANAPKPQGAAK